MGMSQPVVLKSNRYGINLILDADMPFGQLEEEILEKFRESEKFFKNAKIAISFEGRRLSQEEEFSIGYDRKKYLHTGHLCRRSG